MYCNKKDSLNQFKLVFFALLFFLFENPLYSQENRLSDNNSIGWLAYTGTFQIHPKISVHTEFQWRRVNSLKTGQQNLFRSGINFAVKKDLSLNAGYAFAETFPYGDYPVEFTFPEHRIYEQVVLKNTMGRTDLSHRFMLEQRFIGKVSMENNQRNIDWIYLNRMRYRFKAEIPVNQKGWSFAFQDEVFIGWGKNTGANVFDQNRLAVLLGFKLNKNIKLEAGYLNQVLQQGKRVNDNPVFQYNNGFMLSSHLSFDFIKVN